MAAKAQIRSKIDHDKMQIDGRFPSGAKFSFLVTRTGERLDVAFSNDSKELKEQTLIFNQWIKLRKEETNAERFARLEAFSCTCSSGKELIEKMKYSLSSKE
jgi:hypothetical protein